MDDESQEEVKETFFDKYGKYLMWFLVAWFAYAYYLSMNEPKSSNAFMPSQVNNAAYDYGYGEGISLSQNGLGSSACSSFAGDVYAGCLAGISSHREYLDED